MPAQILLRILAFHFRCAFCEMNAAAPRTGSAAQQHNAMLALSTGNPEVLAKAPDGSICC
jgi:hypothetical protein